MINRLLDSECSLGEKYLLIETLGNAAISLTNDKESIQTQYSEPKSNNDGFFENKSIFSQPMVILGTLKRKISSVKKVQGHINHFHKYA